MRKEVNRIAAYTNSDGMTPVIYRGLLLIIYLVLLLLLLGVNANIFTWLYAQFSGQISQISIDNGWPVYSIAKHDPTLQSLLFQARSQWLEFTFVKGFASLDTAVANLLAIFASLLFSSRILTIALKYSSNMLSRYMLGFMAVLAVLPFASHGMALLDAAAKCFSYACTYVITAAQTGPSVAFHGLYVISNSGSLALLLGGSIIMVWTLKCILFPEVYLRRDKGGLFVGTSAWNSLIGERLIAFSDLASVSIGSLKKGGKTLILKLKDGQSYRFPWAEVQKYLSPAELFNDVRTYAPQALDQSCLAKEEFNKHDYTELWLKYFTSAASRNRNGGLKPGERLHEGRYEIAGELGQGGQGTAYLASGSLSEENKQDADKPTTIVLKEYILPVHRGEAILQQSMQKLHREAEILAKIHHPNIVELKDTFVEDHRGYLVLEYVEGNVLKQMVQSQGPQPEKVVLDIALQACDALEHLHSMSPPIIHRDLTPDNLILQPDGRLKLVDFNVAQQLEPTATSTVVGKHAYIPPEQFRGKPTVRSDIFALGGTLHFLLTAKEPEPLTVSHPASVVDSVRRNFDDIVAKATALEQEDRYADVSELRIDLLLLKIGDDESAGSAATKQAD